MLHYVGWPKIGWIYKENPYIPTVRERSGPPILLLTLYRMCDQIVVVLRVHYVGTDRKLRCSDQESVIAESGAAIPVGRDGFG